MGTTSEVGHGWIDAGNRLSCCSAGAASRRSRRGSEHLWHHFFGHLLVVGQRPSHNHEQLPGEAHGVPVLRSTEHRVRGGKNHSILRPDRRQLLRQHPRHRDHPRRAGHDQRDGFSSPTPWVEWYPCTGAGCAKDIVCGLDAFGGQINFDNLDTWLQVGLSCAQAKATNLSVKIRVCAGSSCEIDKVIDMPAIGLSLALGCPLPPTDPCGEPGGSASGASGTSCPYCVRSGGDAGCGVNASGRLSCTPKFGGGGAFLHYTAGGPGTAGLPGSSGTLTWQSRLGNSWS